MIKQGVIIKSLSGFYYISDGKDVIRCRARGSLRNCHQSPCVGDIVEVSDGAVERILERKNMLHRPPVANIDKLFIVSSSVTPYPNPFVIDKTIAMAELNGIESALIFNKSDAGDFNGLPEVYQKSGFETVVTSCETGTGFDQLKSMLVSGINAFTGNSGVGKSSILNHLCPEICVQTGETSEKLGRGRHTTRHVELFSISDGVYIVDTPGFSAIELDGLLKEDIAPLFKDFDDYTGQCRFNSCSHISEKGCAVIEAVNNGDICKSRYDSYKMLYDSLRNVKKWELQKKNGDKR